MAGNGILEFTSFFSILCFWMGLIVSVAIWVGAKTHLANARNPQLQVTLAYGLAITVAGFYSLICFCPILEWVGSRSIGLALAWFILANPIWMFVASLYFNRNYRIAINNS